MIRTASIWLLAIGLCIGCVWVASHWYYIDVRTTYGVALVNEGTMGLLYRTQTLQLPWYWHQIIVRPQPVGAEIGWHWWVLRVTDNPWLYGLTFSPWVPAAFLIVLGAWGLRATHARRENVCPECGYDLRGATSDRCSECGTVVQPDHPRETPPG